MRQRRRERRILAGALIVLGGLLMFLAPTVLPGLFVVGLDVVVE